MQPDFLSDVELFYSSHSIIDDSILIDGEEAHHISHVMRHFKDDVIYLTDGNGSIYKSIISEVGKRNVLARIIKTYSYKNKLKNICFCLPRLRSMERFEFALEKCVELGITNFIVYDSKRTVAKGEKIERWQKILLSAMKQSLRAWLPKVSYAKSLVDVFKQDGVKIIFDQNASQTFQQFLTTNHQSLTANHFFLFGPEGGFDEEECSMISAECRVKLTGNRLRSETAIIAAAVEISLRLNQ